MQPMLLPRLLRLRLRRLLRLLLLLPRLLLLLLLPLLEHEEDRPRSLASAAAAERRTGIEPARAIWLHSHALRKGNAGCGKVRRMSARLW
jgi:hypothetical protein